MPKDFRQKLAKLTYLDFQGHDRHDWLTIDLSDEEMLNELAKMPGPDLFLGRYHATEIEGRLRASGIISKLLEAGYGRRQSPR